MRRWSPTTPRLVMPLWGGALSAVSLVTSFAPFQQLRSVAAMGHDLATVWDARCQLHERNTASKRRDKSEDQGWSWRFPEDLGLRGWVADVHLWLLCRGSSPDAARFGTVMAEHSDPVHLAALARAMVSPEKR